MRLDLLPTVRISEHKYAQNGQVTRFLRNLADRMREILRTNNDPTKDPISELDPELRKFVRVRSRENGDEYLVFIPEGISLKDLVSPARQNGRGFRKFEPKPERIEDSEHELNPEVVAFIRGRPDDRFETIRLCILGRFDIRVSERQIKEVLAGKGETDPLVIFGSQDKIARVSVRKQIIELLTKIMGEYQNLNAYSYWFLLTARAEGKLSEHIPGERAVGNMVEKIRSDGLRPSHERLLVWRIVKSIQNPFTLEIALTKYPNANEAAERAYHGDPRLEKLGMTPWMLAVRDCYGGHWLSDEKIIEANSKQQLIRTQTRV